MKNCCFTISIHLKLFVSFKAPATDEDDPPWLKFHNYFVRRSCCHAMMSQKSLPAIIMHGWPLAIEIDHETGKKNTKKPFENDKNVGCSQK